MSFRRWGERFTEFVSLRFFHGRKNVMKVVKMLLVVGLIVGSSQLASAEDGRSKRDQLRIAVQEICPMTGNKLGTHGAPIKVRVGEEVVFLCCKGCLKQKINPQHWATIHVNIARAQHICPIMKQELPKNPKWTIVNGQIVYVCCPPCTKKIIADPETHLQKVDELYSASLQARRISR